MATPERLKSCHEEVKRLGTLVADLEQLARFEGDSFCLKRRFHGFIFGSLSGSREYDGEINKEEAGSQYKRRTGFCGLR